MIIRAIEPHEHATVGALTVEVYADVLGQTLDDGYRAELARVGERLDDAEVLVAVDTGDAGRSGGPGSGAERGAARGRVLGSITYVPGPESRYAEFTGADEVGLRMLVVAPEVQRRGVGRALVEACIERARATGRRRITLHTAEPLVGAQRFYERLGFDRVPARDWQPAPGVRLLGYELALDPVGDCAFGDAPGGT